MSQTVSHESNQRTKRADDRWLLPVEGVVSGLLTCLIPALPGIGGPMFLFIGWIFGAVISLHCWLFRGLRSPFRIIGFVATCTLAYTVSVFATMWCPFRLQFLNFSGDRQGAVDSSPFLIGGFLGGAIVSAGVQFFLVPAKNWLKFLVKAFWISVLCGFLGVFGWAIGEQMWEARWLPGFGADLDFYTLYMVWQTGAAALLGMLLPRQGSAAVVPVSARAGYEMARLPKKRSMQPMAGIVFFGLVMAGIGWFVARQIQGERMGRRMQAAQQAARERAYAQQVAERPSAENLPNIEPLPVEQMLVLRPISGHPVGNVVDRGTRRLPIATVGDVPKVTYWTNYKRSESASEGEAPFADVSVNLYPNSDWAVYATKGIPLWDLAALYPDDITTVTKFGNKVIKNTVMRRPTGGDLYFYWVSGNQFIRIRFFDQEEDEFLREYLELHPSTL